MAFHHDIIWGKHKVTGEITELFESEYSIQECIRRGWLDTTVPGGLWVRQFIDRSFDPGEEEDLMEYLPLEPTQIPDPCFGQNLKMGWGLGKI
jgi:hypothetical protein